MAVTHWTEDLFLRYPEVFLAVHENAWSTGEKQARDLHALLERFGVPSGGRILDAPCGIGRHSTRLAKMGYRTVGVDLSPVFVARATELARQEGVSDRATYRIGDLRSLTETVPVTEGPFDAALNLWTSLGYYDEETDIRILQEYGKLVRPGGILVVYIVNRDFVVRHFEPQGYEAFGDLVHIEQRHLDLVTSRMRNVWRFFRRNGEDLDHVLTVPIEHCIYSLHELRRLLVRGGWHPIEAFGGLVTLANGAVESFLDFGGPTRPSRHWKTSRRFGCSFRRKASRSVRTCSMRHAGSVDERLGWPNPDTRSPQSIRTRSESRRQRNGSPLQLPVGLGPWQLPLWVNLVILTVGRPLPVYPYKQTFSEPVGTWQKCQGAMSTEPSS